MCPWRTSPRRQPVISSSYSISRKVLLMLNIRTCLSAFLFIACSAAHAGVYEDMLQAIDISDERGVANLLKRGVDVDTVAPNGNTILMLAAKEGKPGMVKTILAARPKINARNPYGETALMLAVFNGHTEVVKQLLAQGAEVNHDGWTPLLYATSRGRVDIAKLLVTQGAKVNSPARNGTTALMMAAREGHLQMVLFLLEQGADLTQKNDDGQTALKLAQDRGWREIVDMLTRAGAKEQVALSTAKERHTPSPT